MRKLLTGNEAIARGAYEAGVRFASAYPGTPSTEILQNLVAYDEILAEWAPNEKVSLEAVIGASLGGVRAICSMKHVGLNVAADPYFTFAYTGVNAGVVIITADEPGTHSSQNEQDNRWYALSAKVPMFEPANSQECLDMVKEAFELSEQYDTPVLLRLTTRVCHSKGVVICSERISIEAKPYLKDADKYVMVPSNAVKRRAVVEKRMRELADFTNKSKRNYIERGGKIGVVASGVCRHYAKEVFGNEATYLHLGFTNPLPGKLLDEFSELVDEIYVIEENDPYMRTWINAKGHRDKVKAVFPQYGELTPDVLRTSLGRPNLPSTKSDKASLLGRPPTLCAGCPHRGFYYELSKRKNICVTGDIGCYSLGFTQPFNAMDSCICMGGAFSIGHGFSQAQKLTGGDIRTVGILGDSTFFHMGINSLIEVVYNNSKSVCVILDNRITAMTGGQQHPGTGKTAKGENVPAMDIAAIVRAIGIKLLIEVNPNDLKAVRDALDEALAFDGPSVILTKWPCVLKKMDENEKALYGNPFTKKLYVSKECIGCKLCIKCGCPAISMKSQANSSRPKSYINAVQCVGCDVCSQICPKNAIKEME